MATIGVIETCRLRIEPFSEQHLTPRYVSWLNDPDVVRYSEQRHYQHTLESCRAYWLSFAGTPNYFCAIVERDERPRHIGNISVYVSPSHSVADVGIMIGEKALWGRGYASEAWNAICDYLLKVLVIRKVTAGTLSANSSMLKVMQRGGMVEDGRRVRHCLFEGKEVDMVHTALFREPDHSSPVTRRK